VSTSRVAVREQKSPRGRRFAGPLGRWVFRAVGEFDVQPPMPLVSAVIVLVGSLGRSARVVLPARHIDALVVRLTRGVAVCPQGLVPRLHRLGKGDHEDAATIASHAPF
jgi:hypothetical protein